MARFRMKRIERPRWADKPDVRLSDMLLADYQAIQRRREQMLKVVQKEIESYLNTENLIYDDPEDEGFPNRLRMTGDYYIGDESYTQHVGPLWFQIGIMWRCLGRSVLKNSRPDDYLGLEVWLRCELPRWTFKVFQNTDSSVI